MVRMKNIRPASDRKARAAIKAENRLCHAASKYSQALDRVALDVMVESDLPGQFAYNRALAELRDAAYGLVRVETEMERAVDEGKR